MHYVGFLQVCGVLYAAGHDIKDPCLSPVYGDFLDFPPTLLVSGTRDLFLSNPVHNLTRFFEQHLGSSAD